MTRTRTSKRQSGDHCNRESLTVSGIDEFKQKWTDLMATSHTFCERTVLYTKIRRELPVVHEELQPIHKWYSDQTDAKLLRAADKLMTHSIDSAQGTKCTDEQLSDALLPEDVAN